MAGDQTSGSFSAGTAAVYIFNLIVGTGALALPAAFAMAGWASATVLLLLLALLSRRLSPTISRSLRRMTELT